MVILQIQARGNLLVEVWWAAIGFAGVEFGLVPFEEHKSECADMVLGQSVDMVLGHSADMGLGVQHSLFEPLGHICLVDIGRHWGFVVAAVVAAVVVAVFEERGY